MAFEKKPAIWNEVNEHFAVSEKGAIKPLGTKRPCFFTADQAKYILDNIESLKEAVDGASKNKMEIVIQKEVEKQLYKLTKQLMALGLPEDRAREQALATIMSVKQAV